jgi:streptogramin lyase
MEEGPDGAIWVNTAGQGAYRWQDGTWQQFYPGELGVQLPSPDVHTIAFGPDGEMWFGTDAGATWYDGTNWQTFQVGDGLVNNYIYDIYVHPSGIVWFATRGGASQYVPE